MTKAFKERHAQKEDWWENDKDIRYGTLKTKWVNDKANVQALAENCLGVALSIMLWNQLFRIITPAVLALLWESDNEHIV
jgi:hypothetical protein